MKKLTLFLAVFTVLILSFLFAGCSTSKTIVKEFDGNGKIIKITESNKNIAESISESTKNKTLIIYTTGWKGGIKAVFGDAENPTPTGKIFAQNGTAAYISKHKDDTTTDPAEVIKNINGNFKINFDGIETNSKKSEVKNE